MLSKYDLSFQRPAGRVEVARRRCLSFDIGNEVSQPRCPSERSGGVGCCDIGPNCIMSPVNTFVSGGLDFWLLCLPLTLQGLGALAPFPVPLLPKPQEQNSPRNARASAASQLKAQCLRLTRRGHRRGSCKLRSCHKRGAGIVLASGPHFGKR